MTGDMMSFIACLRALVAGRDCPCQVLTVSQNIAAALQDTGYGEPLSGSCNIPGQYPWVVMYYDHRGTGRPTIKITVEAAGTRPLPAAGGSQ